MELNDFVESIIIKGESAFNLTSLEITSSQLHQVLHDAIQISSVKLRKDNVERIDSKIFNPQLETFGWDSFLIDYKIGDLPILDLLQLSMVKYLKIFHFLEIASFTNAFKIQLLGVWSIANDNDTSC